MQCSRIIGGVFMFDVAVQSVRRYRLDVAVQSVRHFDMADANDCTTVE